MSWGLHPESEFCTFRDRNLPLFGDTLDRFVKVPSMDLFLRQITELDWRIGSLSRRWHHLYGRRLWGLFVPARNIPSSPPRPNRRVIVDCHLVLLLLRLLSRKRFRSRPKLPIPSHHAVPLSASIGWRGLPPGVERVGDDVPVEGVKVCKMFQLLIFFGRPGLGEEAVLSLFGGEVV